MAERTFPDRLQSTWDNATPGGPLWMIRGLLNGATAIGGGATGQYDVTPEVPGQVSDADLARLNATNDELTRRVLDFASIATPRPMPAVSAIPLALPGLPPGARVTGIGPNGPVVDGMQGRYSEALGWLRDAKTGDVKGVLNHPEMPDRPIDLIYGDKGFGVRHIDEHHPGHAESLPGIFSELPIKEEGPSRIVLQDDAARAVVAKNFLGEPKDWLLTYLKFGSQPGGKSIDGAAVRGPTHASSDRLTDRNIAPFLPSFNQPPPMVPLQLVPLSLLRRENDGQRD